MKISLMPGKLGVCRLESDRPFPKWALNNHFFSITVTADETSIVCREELIPDDCQAERGFRAFKVEGPLDFHLTGILSSLINPLAEAAISIFVISTYDTDYILIKEDQINRAADLLKNVCTIN